ncbi:hypothetical protein EJ110_NYTH01394 [Nymphaea thermarum]|nr:hypothetical protein EJ110_NYTH01394 [Nymphaea thermarum]
MVSCLGERGTTPALLVSPTVGLIPTTEFLSAGQMMEPCVSVPSDTATMLAATPMAEPVLEPYGLAVATYGFCTIGKHITHYEDNPIRELQRKRTTQITLINGGWQDVREERAHHGLTDPGVPPLGGEPRADAIPLAHGGLPQDDGPATPQPPRHARISPHSRAHQRQRSRCRVQTVLRPDRVLEQHRNPVQRRPSPSPLPPLLIGLVRQGKCLRVHLDDGPEPRVELVDGVQVVLHQLPRGQLLPVEGGPYLLYRRLLELELRRAVSSINGDGKK